MATTEFQNDNNANFFRERARRCTIKVFQLCGKMNEHSDPRELKGNCYNNCMFSANFWWFFSFSVRGVQQSICQIRESQDTRPLPHWPKAVQLQVPVRVQLHQKVLQLFRQSQARTDPQRPGKNQLPKYGPLGHPSLHRPTALL